MLIDRTHKPWVFGSTLVLAVSASAYWAVAKHSPHGPSGGSVFGLIFGIVGSLFMIFASMLAVRKKLPTWRIGSAQFWLRGHLWLGTLGFALILFHAGFSWGGLLENLLWISFGLVVMTGFAGVALQQVIPRLLTTSVPLETMVAQIPFLSRTMLFRADQLIAKHTGAIDVDYEPLQRFAEEVLKQQRVLKRESDLPKELAKVYANVVLPEADAKKSLPHTPAEIVNTKAARDPRMSQGEGAGKSADESADNDSSGVLPAASAETTPVAKPKKSPLELMREKAAAKADSAAPVSVNANASSDTESEKKLSPIEQMRAKAAAKQVTNTGDSLPPLAVAPARESTPPAVEKKLSPIEQMRAKMAAKQPSPPNENERVADSPATNAPEKKLSPLEQMQAKLATAKGSSADKSTDTHKPLTVETASVVTESANDKSALPAVKKPMPASKPAMEKPIAVAPPKTSENIELPVPPALLAELRNFHLRVVRPFLIRGRSPQFRLDDAIAARRVFSQLRSDLPVELHAALQQLEDFCEERRQFNTQKRFHRWLHWWLVLHIPPSIALLVLFVAHVIVSLRVVPFGK